MKRFNPLITLLVAAGFFLLAIPALAQGAEDGMNSNAGAKAALAGALQGATFEQIDADRDGRVSQEEFAALSPATRTSRSFDPNNESTGGRNGATTGVDRVPMNDDTQRTTSGPGMAGSAQNTTSTIDTFREFDRDRDGYLSRNELEAAKRNSGVRTTR